MGLAHVQPSASWIDSRDERGAHPDASSTTPSAIDPSGVARNIYMHYHIYIKHPDHTDDEHDEWKSHPGAGERILQNLVRPNPARHAGVALRSGRALRVRAHDRARHITTESIPPSRGAPETSTHPHPAQRDLDLLPPGPWTARLATRSSESVSQKLRDLLDDHPTSRTGRELLRHPGAFDQNRTGTLLIQPEPAEIRS